jgi:high affinity Mn2+ porin
MAHAGTGGSTAAGFAFVSNGISRHHQQYLALGGLSFLLGNGRLNYGCENILETYYTLHAWRGFHPSFGFQFVDHPGYERDRGPSSFRHFACTWSFNGAFMRR